jgi:uncharacterized protein YkwD
MVRSMQLAGALVALVALGGASLTYAAVGQIDRPAAVDSAAVRIDPPDDAGLTPEQRAAFAMVELVNAERSRRGLRVLTWDDRVGAAAAAHAADMAAHRRMGHEGSDGSDAGDRLRRAGFDWTTWGENVGAGFTTAPPLFDAWMGSPGHRAHLLGDFRYVGVGAVAAVDGTPYWALVVAS